MSRTAAGEALLDAAIERGAVVAEPLEIGQVDLMQPAQARRKRVVQARTAAALATGQPRPRMKGLDVAKAAKTAGWWENLKNFVGTTRRIVHGRR